MGTTSVTPILWIGPFSDVLEALRIYVLQDIAVCKGCGICCLCRSLNNSFCVIETVTVPPFVVILSPKEHGYVREQVDEVLSLISVALDSHEESVIVISYADQLTSATANRLLKVIEEPPAGWHFILTTERPEEVLPTLRSRCVEKVMDNAAQIDESCYSAALSWFENPQPATWLDMARKVDQLPKTVPATIRALDQLIAFWHKKWADTQDPRAADMLTILTGMTDRTPASGSATAFWRVLLPKIYKILGP